MHAMVMNAVGGPLAWTHLPDRQPGPGLCPQPGGRLGGLEFLGRVPKIGIVTPTTAYPLQQADEALAEVRAGRFHGAAALVP